MSTRRKGLSPEEKKEKIKEFFHMSPTIYSSKEIEAEASKYTGLTQVQCKETIQSLVEDGIVNSEKMGSSTYYWAFASFEFDQKKDKIVELTEELKNTKEKILNETKNIEKLKGERIDSEKRTKDIEKLQKLKDDNKEFKEELTNYADSELMEQLKKDVKTAIAAVNRYTDNISSLRQYCDKKFAIRGEDFDKNFGINPDMDYMEDYK
ncbi:hypothetical protein DICPUDRAFT_77611 [Dictyostelium purpureum]|uniref:Meiotic nuclear division protein 1 homolog n=1 Tax=Dictyostelium purpureum TaxID=5786 RepID=F0ZH50_DICPU|nr:uncharacterized protein DICPUDRAFT_77611 [Dictyostelium purpureum]EGC36731.1 hypothetical protein DICPUDRAFT_77611 [Dictyostelium purpureum]|eukprot:XP_003286756.1 hypothetical protein DICPUDRAFT_77611 [Dictyostelium purpureum]